MQLILFEFVSPRLHLQRSSRMSTANPISKFASAPKPWAALTNSYAPTLSAFQVRCSMNFSVISLPASPHTSSTILSKKVWMMTRIIPTPIYLLPTPTIQLISPKVSKMVFVKCNSNINVPASVTDTEAVYKGVGYTHTYKGLSESLVEIQEATPASQVSKTNPQLRVGPDAKEPQEFPPLSRCGDTKTSNGR